MPIKALGAASRQSYQNSPVTWSRVNRATQEITHPPLHSINWDSLRDNDSVHNYQYGLQMAKSQSSSSKAVWKE